MNNLEMKRYSRHIILDGIGIEGQEKLKQSKVLIIGFGGLGTGVGMYLTRMGIGHLGIVDSDCVDISNLQRQILYDEKDVGKSKLKSGIEKLKKINSNLIVDEYEFMLNEENANELIKKYDVIVDCTDNLSTRGVINRACIDNDKKCVFGGVNDFNGFIYTYEKGSSCFECVMGDIDRLREKDKSNKTLGVIGAMVGLISSMQSLEVAKIILGIGKLTTNEMIIVDGNDFTTSIIPVSRNNKCYCNMKLNIKEEDYDKIINHCKRKLNQIYYDDETKEQQAFGVIVGEKNKDGINVTRVVNLKRNYRFDPETSKKMNAMLEKYAIPGGIEINERAWAIDPVELNEIIIDLNENEMFLGTYHMHSDLSWTGDYPKELPTKLDRELNKGNNLINLIVCIEKNNEKIRAFYESDINKEYEMIKTKEEYYGNKI